VSQVEKLIGQLKVRPDVFRYSDLRRILKHLGYSEVVSGKTSGSRVRFVSISHPPINLHKPHPGDEMRAYVIKDIVGFLEDEGLI
jgi:hypothetical protein